MLMIRQAPSSIASAAAAHGVDGLVQADRRAKLPLQPRVVEDVVVVERLLDHHQLEPVELGEQLDVREGVGRVRVDHQRQTSPNRSRMRSTAATSHPGLILILMRR